MLHYVRMVSAFGFTLQVVYDISFIVNELDNLRPLNIIKHLRHDFIFRFKVIGVNVKGASFAVLQIKSPGWCPELLPGSRRCSPLVGIIKHHVPVIVLLRELALYLKADSFLCFNISINYGVPYFAPFFDRPCYLRVIL